ncbi:MAG: hypothetical protein ACI9KN_002567 [Gammaproteobacteria bacterium]|jgi:hypothetical protein
MDRSLLFIVLLMPVIASSAGSISDTQPSSIPAVDNHMLIDKPEHEVVWREFTGLYEAIQSETNREKLEHSYDDADQWQQDYADMSSQVMDPLIAILADEIRRKNEQLRNKPGRQQATDWFKSLQDHSMRMEYELSVLGLFDLTSGKGEQAQILVELILNSLEFSTRLVAADQSQITRRFEAGDFVVSQQQAELIDTASENQKKAMSRISQH